MKKALSLLLAIVMVLSLMPVSVFAAGSPTIYFETTFNNDLAVGDAFTVTANLKDNVRFDAMTLSLKWNESAIKFTGFTENRGVPQSTVCGGEGYTPAAVNQNIGKFAANDQSSYGYDKNGMIFIANFEIVGEGALDIGLKTDDPTVFEMVDNNGADLAPVIDYAAISGLTVGGKAVGPEIPEELAYLGVVEISTDKGSVIRYEEVEDGFDYIPYYIITIPYDAQYVYVTDTEQYVLEDCQYNNERRAQVYVYHDAEICGSYIQEFVSLDCVENQVGETLVPTVTIPVQATLSGMYGEFDANMIETTIDDETYTQSIYGSEISTTECTYCLSFRYGTASDDGEEEETYSITVNQTTGGTVTVDKTTAAKNDTITIVPEPDEGYRFVKVQINGEDYNLGEKNGCYIMGEENITITAVFEKEHTCSYGAEVVDAKYLKFAATCKSGAVYYKSCTCGEFATTAETFVSGDPAACSYGADGKCIWCGEAATEPILSFTAGGQTLEAVTAEDYCSEFEVTAQKLTVTVPAGVNTVTINCAASMCAYIDHVSSDLSPTGKSAEIDLTQDLTFVCVPVTLDDGSDAYYHVYFEQEAGDVDPEPEDPDVTPGYSFATSADVSTENGGTAVVHVKITGHTDSDVTTYNAYDVTLTFDSDKLEYESFDGAVKSDKGQVKVEGNTIRIVGCGADKVFNTEIAALTFKTKAEGPASVKIDKVQVSDNEDAASKDIPDATPKHDENDNTADETPSESIIVVPYPVTKPKFVNGEGKVIHGDNYTFFFADTDHYNYSALKVTVGGKDVTLDEPVDGVYTIKNVTGAVKITATQTAKSYAVTKPESVTGADTATYGIDYIFTVTPSEGKEIESVKVNGSEEAYTINKDGAYVIAGNTITAPITITVTEKDKEEPVVPTTTVTFSGVEVSEVEGGLMQTAEIGKDFTFKLNKDANYTYNVKVGETELSEVEGVYTIPAELVVEGGVIVTITKTAIKNLKVDVKQYINLDGKTMFLVTAKWDDKVLAYGEGNTMFYSSKYTVTGETAPGAYCWLVVSSEEMNTVDQVKAAAEAAIVETSATATAVAYDCDVNGTTKVDVNDAQLAYDMYKASYMEFTGNLTMDKFLEADVNGDGMVNTTDVAAIINQIIGVTNTPTEEPEDEQPEPEEPQQ